MDISCLVERNKISQLIKALGNEDFAHELINPEDIHAYPDADCYVSPLEICWFFWKSEHGSEMARYINAGEKWGNTQSVLLADKVKLDEYLIENNMQLIWMVRVLREVSNKARENFADFFIDNDKSYLIWKNSRGWKERKIIFDK